MAKGINFREEENGGRRRWASRRRLQEAQRLSLLPSRDNELYEVVRSGEKKAQLEVALRNGVK